MNTQNKPRHTNDVPMIHNVNVSDTEHYEQEFKKTCVLYLKENNVSHKTARDRERLMKLDGVDRRIQVI